MTDKPQPAEDRDDRFVWKPGDITILDETGKPISPEELARIIAENSSTS
jgi:hypothetical protein